MLDGSVDRGICCQHWWPELDPQDPHSRRRALTPTSCPLIFTCVPGHVHMHECRQNTGTHVCTHLNKRNTNMKYVVWFCTLTSLVTSVYKLYLQTPLSKQTNELEKEHGRRMGPEIERRLVKEKGKRKSSGDGNETWTARQKGVDHVGQWSSGSCACLPLKCLLIAQWEGLPALGLGCGPAGGGMA